MSSDGPTAISVIDVSPLQAPGYRTARIVVQTLHIFAVMGSEDCLLSLSLLTNRNLGPDLQRILS